MRYRPINAIDTTEVRQFHGNGNTLVVEVRRPYLEEEGLQDTIWIEIGHSPMEHAVRAVELDAAGALALRDWLDRHLDIEVIVSPRQVAKIRRA